VQRHPADGPTPLDTARRTRNRAAVATASAAVVALAAFGYLPRTDGPGFVLTLAVLVVALVALGGLLAVFTRAVFDVVDLGNASDRAEVG